MNKKLIYKIVTDNRASFSFEATLLFPPILLIIFILVTIYFQNTTEIIIKMNKDSDKEMKKALPVKLIRNVDLVRTNVAELMSRSKPTVKTQK